MLEKFLQKVSLFTDLPQEDLTRLSQMVEELRLPVGQILFVEGSVADKAYILYEGELEIIKQLEHREVLITVRHLPGTVIGETALLETGTRLATVRASRDSRLLGLSQQQMDQLFMLSPRAAKIMLQTFMRRWGETEAQVRLNEKMAQLGTFTAGIAHELGNPTAAVLRSSHQLGALLSAAIQTHVAFGRLELSAEQQAKMEELTHQVEAMAAHPLGLDSLARSDLEAQLENWLEGQAIPDAWQLAPTLVSVGFQPAQLNELAGVFAADFPLLLELLANHYAIYSLLSEVYRGASRTDVIVQALKSYIYLDQAPLQNVDIHASLDNTLTLLGSKLEGGIVLKREYAPQLPRITAYGSELNQVWSNLLQNAIDALGEQGHIIIRTRQQDGVVIEIENNGPAIAAEDLPKIFDPFFTTKPLGKGVGLGLSTSYNIVHKHKGDIRVCSEAGRTVFEVRLPFTPDHN